MPQGVNVAWYICRCGEFIQPIDRIEESHEKFIEYLGPGKILLAANTCPGRQREQAVQITSDYVIAGQSQTTVKSYDVVRSARRKIRLMGHDANFPDSQSQSVDERGSGCHSLRVVEAVRVVWRHARREVGGVYVGYFAAKQRKVK